MIFVEIVLEGVRCFKQLLRLPLKPGFNLIYGPNESGKTTLSECLYILLDPLRNVGEELDYPTWGPPGNSRAGLVMQEGQDSYRVTKDFVNGQVSLGRRNPQTQKYENVSTDPSKIDAFLRQTAGIPPVSTFKRLFCFDREDLPSGRPKVVVKQVKVGVAPSADPFAAPQGFGAPVANVPMQPPAGYGMTVDEKKRRIEELRGQRDKAKANADAQYEIDGLEAKVFEIENKIKEITTHEDQLDQVDSALRKLSSFSELPKDIVRRIEDFEGAQREQNKLVSSLDSRVAEAQSSFTAVNSRIPFFKEKNFLIGLACIVASIVVQVALIDKMAILKVLPPLLIIAGFGLAFWVVWNELNSRGAEKEANENLKKLHEELREHEKKFEVESSVIKRMMVDAGVEDPKELHDKLKEYRNLTDRAEDLKIKIDKSKRVMGFNQLDRERNGYKERIEELTRTLREAGTGGFVQDPADIQKEIDALQFSIDHPDQIPPPIPGRPAAPMGAPMMPGPPVPSIGGGGDDFLGGGDELSYNPGVPQAGGGAPPMPSGDSTMISDGAAPSPEGAENPVDTLWASAEAFAGMNRTTLIMQIKERFNSYVQAFTNGQYSEGDLSSEKTVSLRTSTGSYIDLDKLAPSSRDAAWLALKLSVVESLCKKKVLPVVMDDPLRLFDDHRLANISKALKRVGGLGQVILVSTQKAHGKITENAISLVPPAAKT